jgi:hypothetical protein
MVEFDLVAITTSSPNPTLKEDSLLVLAIFFIICSRMEGLFVSSFVLEVPTADDIEDFEGNPPIGRLTRLLPIGGTFLSTDPLIANDGLVFSDDKGLEASGALAVPWGRLQGTVPGTMPGFMLCFVTSHEDIDTEALPGTRSAYSGVDVNASGRTDAFSDTATSRRIARA